MTTNHRADLHPIVSALRFLPTGDFELGGYPAPPVDPYAERIAGALAPIVTRLQNHLYAHCFTRRYPSTLTVEPPPGGNFVQNLSSANAGIERWDRGWQIDQALSSGSVLVHRSGEFRTVWPGEFLAQDAFGHAPQPGASVSIFLPRESLTIQPGYYFAFSQTPADPLDEKYLFRLYWNTPASSATALLHEITSTFNCHGLPFRFKLPTDPSGYSRVDTAVAYIPRRYFSLGVDLALAIHARLHSSLRQDVPLFTRRLAAGLAFAEDPGTAESFGTARCRALAQGLWTAHETRSVGLDAFLACVETVFEREGLSLDHPYLNFGSAGYDFPED